MIEETYFGWARLTHTEGCDAPSWEIDVRHDAGIRPLTQSTAVIHQCPDENCGHSSSFDRVTVRIVCRSCTTVHLITGEGLGRATTSTEALGYGQPPRRLDGLYLWPSPPVLYGYGPGRSGLDDQPREYLVTTTLADRLTPGMCVGAIGRHFNAAHKPLWWAGAIQTPPPTRLTGQVHRLAWKHRTNEHTSVEAAAAWIATAIDPAQQRPLVVAV